MYLKEVCVMLNVIYVGAYIGKILFFTKLVWLSTTQLGLVSYMIKTYKLYYV